MDIIHALANKSRLAIMGQLAEGEKCACVIPKLVYKSQPNVSRHLCILLGAGLVRMRVDGTKRLYSLSPLGRRAFRDISRWKNES